jgi:hypothetical protein
VGLGSVSINVYRVKMNSAQPAQGLYLKKEIKITMCVWKDGDRIAHTNLQKVFKTGWAAGQLDTFIIEPGSSSAR